MKPFTSYRDKCNRYLKTLQCSIDHFRIGNDNQGLSYLMDSLVDIEMILHDLLISEDDEINFSKLHLSLENIYEKMRNQDVHALIDELEFILYPLMKEWLDGSEAQ